MYLEDPARLTKINGIPFITFPVLERIPFIKHAFSTRLGGVSTGIYSSMNLNDDRGDDPEAVRENFNLVARALDTECSRMVLSDQTHTSNVRVVTEKDAGKGLVKEQDYRDVDGMITNVPGLMLVTSHADCVPLFFVDPVHRAIGMTHSGWKGTWKRIGRVTVEKMRESYGSDPKDIIAVIGPSICQDCYEVGEDLLSAFREEFTEQQCQAVFRPGKPGKYQLDLWQANRIILEEAGLTPKHITISGLCTSCRSDLLWSHRKTKGQRGGLCAFLELIPEETSCE